ncbi:hypothetical protein ACFO8O_05235 [Hephaestia sp. GCM10023244]|uniref:hypothetical protein n=1 Tax=unclassified Hephaestia TaxID=2631281 RepID=UPI002076FCFA|nr:hypothetical protein [Hephaestia sp. MAHUQ-44]MCM8730370.1 hypothetical protein [Hephaestia sp. MAHUQ-44]
MRRVRSFLIAAGFALAVVGAVFLLQGLAIIRWPAGSSMVGDVLWVNYGAGLAVLGLFIVIVARRLR